MIQLITGATGRIGQELAARSLRRGLHVRALVLPDDPELKTLERRNVEVVAGSLTDLDAVGAAVEGVDTVVHLAAVMLWGEGADRRLFEQNVKGTFNLLDATVERGVALSRFLLASSDEVYPSLKARYLPIDETHSLDPYSFYGLTKETNERFAFYYRRAHGVPATVARFALTARSDEILRPDGWSGRFLFVAPMRDLFSALGRPDAVAALDAACNSNASSTLLLALDECGVPYEFQMCDVVDLVDGIELMLSNPSAVGQVFNLSGPAPFSYRTAVEALHDATGLPFVEVRIPGPPIRIAHDTSKARSILGYAPTRDVRRIVDIAVRGNSAPERTPGE